MTLLFCLLCLAWPAADIAVTCWRTYVWTRRTRSIGNAAIKELQAAGEAARLGDSKAAETHMARFRELNELREEESRKK